MYNSKIHFLLAFSILMLFNACKKENNPTPTNPSNEVKWDNSEKVNASIIGTVLDENNQAVKAAMVSVGTHSTITDEDGVFFFSKINTPTSATAIKVSKQGYFDGVQNMVILADEDNHTQIHLLSLPSSVSLDAGTGGTASFPDGSSVQLPAGGIVMESTGQNYTGTVEVYSRFVDHEQHAEWLPGGYRAVNSNGGEQILQTKAVQAVELRSTSGQKLQIASGAKATITSPIPSGMQSSAPNSINCWSLDADNAMWMEEGSGDLQGSAYVAEVSHFSFWCFGVPGPSVIFTLEMEDQNGNPAPNIYATLTCTSLLHSSTSITNSAGRITGAIPANNNYNLSYSYGYCLGSGGNVYLTSFNSGTSNFTQGPFNVSTSNSSLSGLSVDCNGSSIAFAPVKCKINGKTVALMTNNLGEFSLSYPCLTSPSTAFIEVFDPSNNLKSTTTISISPNMHVNAGNLSACATAYQSIQWDVTIPPATTPTSYSLSDPDDQFGQSLYNGYNHFYGNSNSSTDYIAFYFDGPQSTGGTHNLLGWGDHVDSFIAVSNTPVNIQQYGAVGDIIKGDFIIPSATSVGAYNGAKIECAFQVTRKQ